MALNQRHLVVQLVDIDEMLRGRAEAPLRKCGPVSHEDQAAVHIQDVQYSCPGKWSTRGHEGFLRAIIGHSATLIPVFAQNSYASGDMKKQSCLGFDHSVCETFAPYEESLKKQATSFA